MHWWNTGRVHQVFAGGVEKEGDGSVLEGFSSLP